MWNLKQFENIPQELKNLSQWVCYRVIPKEGHWGKRIISPVTGQLARSNASETWTDFHTASEYAEKYRFDGLAIALTGGIVFVDIDEAIDGDERRQKNLNALIEKLQPTYCETSTSGKGIHFLFKGRMPDYARCKNDAANLEMYERGRFVCMTGNVVGSCTELREIPAEMVAHINKKFIGEPIPDYMPTVCPASESDSELIDRILESRQGEKFSRLYNGDISGYGSQSSADMALAKILAFWTQDPSQIDSIFRSSGLYRPKWDKCGGYYGKRTIDFAMRMTSVTRKPPRRKYTAEM